MAGRFKLKNGDEELAKKVYAIEDGMVLVFNDDFPDEYDLNTGENATHGLFYTNRKYNALNNKWNKCEIIVMGDKYTIHKLNGVIVNMGTNLSHSEGMIDFQSETAEKYYRNIEIKEFDEIVPMEKFIKK